MDQDLIDFKLISELNERQIQESSLFASFDFHPFTNFSPLSEQTSQTQLLQNSKKIYENPSQPLKKGQFKVQKEKKKRLRKYISKNPNNQKGHWTHQQNLKYHYFLELHADYFIDTERRKLDKIFKSMAAFIDTRETYQCRSHHQKVQKKWGNFASILINLRVQNFKRADSQSVIRQLKKLGFDVSRIPSENQLKCEWLLNKKISEGKGTSVDESKTEQNIEISRTQDNVSCDEDYRFQCLMMSDKYEDQLQI